MKTILNKTGIFLIPILLMAFLPSCLTYYQKQEQFSRAFANGDFDKANQLLTKDKKAEKRKTKLLHFLNMGVVYHYTGQYALSNEAFEKAYVIADTYHKNILDESLALVSNPKVIEYKGEDFELLQLHYFKALNFLYLNDYEAALVECRRMNIKLNALNDKYQSNHRYRRDAFIQNLMGLIYDASGDANNAFIAYRNAYDIYKEDYSQLYNIQPPHQLKLDLLRAAANTGFYDQLEFYEKEFGFKYTNDIPKSSKQLILFWQNGLGPVKDEWSIDFTIIGGSDGWVYFNNDFMGLSFPFYIGTGEEAKKQLGGLKIIRIAFPKYLERKPLYAGARAVTSNKSYELELAQDINAIAFKSLEDRMLREMGKALMRLATKQAAEMALRKENQNAGMALGLVNAISEQADTRNWQTIPHSISYSRIILPENETTFQLEILAANQNTVKTITIEPKFNKGKTSFLMFHSLQSHLPL
ncbi:MAG: hypothetical protein GX587_06950 [Bacteroidales bacterium]|nr:hypothetical protein [Bacteroidales bacterium]